MDAEKSDISQRKIVLSGIQPSGSLTIGNYLGAVLNYVRLTEENECFYCIADLHSLTISPPAERLRKNCYELAASLIASGLDVEKCTLFLQSHVPAHSELLWILSCHTMFGEARRMTQFKEKSGSHPENVNVGLFTYPVLQAADILLYQADFVPVGQDQKQHLELARDLAVRFNGKYSPTFKIPEPLIPSKKSGAKIMSLQEPEKKMSKSDANPSGYILLLDPPDVIRGKIRRAVTDSGEGVVFSKDKPGISNLLTILAAFSGEKLEKCEADAVGKSYAQFKETVAECVVEKLKPVQSEFARVSADKQYLASVLAKGAENARYAARKTLSKVQRKIGLV